MRIDLGELWGIMLYLADSMSSATEDGNASERESLV